jgi:hypothetical protein
MTVISVIIGSTRQGRFSEKPAQWILQHLKERSGVDARLLDLRDFPIPFFDQPVSPATPGRPPYENEIVTQWTAAIAGSDGFVFVTPEYNYGPSRSAPLLRIAAAASARTRARVRCLWLSSYRIVPVLDVGDNTTVWSSTICVRGTQDVHRGGLACVRMIIIILLRHGRAIDLCR